MHNAIVTRVRRHHPPVRAPRGFLAAGRFTLFDLSHCVTCKTTYGTEHRNSEEYLDHPPTSIAERLAKNHPKPDEFAALATTLRDCRTEHRQQNQSC
jgi:hypothetical protein